MKAAGGARKRPVGFTTRPRGRAVTKEGPELAPRLVGMQNSSAECGVKETLISCSELGVCGHRLWGSFTLFVSVFISQRLCGITAETDPKKAISTETFCLNHSFPDRHVLNSSPYTCESVHLYL